MRETIGNFSIYGDLAEAEITAALSLQPSDFTPKGTWYEGADFPSQTAEWELHCPAELTMCEQIDYLLGQLWPQADTLSTLSLLHHADFNISGEGSEVLELNPKKLKQLAQLNVHLNCFFTDKA